MVLTTLLLYKAMRAKRYATFSVNPALLTAAFLIVDLGFVEANLDLDRWRDSLNPLTAAGFAVYLVRRYS
jgi:K+ transporter